MYEKLADTDHITFHPSPGLLVVDTRHVDVLISGGLIYTWTKVRSHE